MTKRTQTYRQTRMTEMRTWVGYGEAVSMRAAILYSMKCPMIVPKINDIETRTCYYIYNDSINYEEYLRSITT
jgi:hypothetical protein